MSNRKNVRRRSAESAALYPSAGGPERGTSLINPGTGVLGSSSTLRRRQWQPTPAAPRAGLRNTRSEPPRVLQRLHDLSPDYLIQDASRCGFHVNRREFESCPVGRIEDPTVGPFLARPDRTATSMSLPRRYGSGAGIAPHPTATSGNWNRVSYLPVVGVVAGFTVSVPTGSSPSSPPSENSADSTSVFPSVWFSTYAASTYSPATLIPAPTLK